VSEAEKFFIGEAIRHARLLPFADCLEFLRGLAESIGDEHPAKQAITGVLAQLTATDAQLELLQVGQTQLRFA
jgi:hypothetical protein